ncbi:MAG: hypothetical protein IKH54_07570 [Bacilli bacterium]|nr:hypothetical protein [Bacilli bacterium]
MDLLMILVTLGTQDKSFERLLKAIDREIEKGNIKDKVVVQAGYTKYESSNMEIFDLIPNDEFDKLVKEADLIITHGGVGSILSAIKNNKKVIAAPRLKKYKEHTNDHQKEIIEEFVNDGYILGLNDFNKLDKVLTKSKTFKPKKFVSNTNNMIDLINNYIEKDNHTSWYNKYSYIIKYFFIIFIYVLISMIIKNCLYRYFYTPSNIGIHNILRFHFFVFIFINYFICFKWIFNSKFKISHLILYNLSNIFIYFICLINLKNITIIYLVYFIISLLINKFIIFDQSIIKKLLKKTLTYEEN